LETKLTVAEEALSVNSAKTEELNEQVNSLVREKILDEAAESLADTQQDRLKALAEGIEFEDAETFAKKVNTIKECYFKGKTEVIEEDSKGSYKVTEVIVEEDTNSDLSPTMQNYVKALGRISKASNLAK
jgi:activator of HSP90 ATPase